MENYESIRKYAPILHTGFANVYNKEQMDEFNRWVAERGFAGYSIQGRSLEPTNDIEGWLKGFLNSLSFAAEGAKEKGLEIWIFDEWGYPTGTAGGNTMKGKPHWRSKKLNLAVDMPLEQGQTVEFTAPPHFLAASVWPVGRSVFGPALGEDLMLSPDANGKISYTCKRKRERLCMVTWEFDDFRTVGIFVPDPESDEQGTLDLLNYEAVAYLLTQMHERYIPELGKYFGKELKGFFYDEPFISFPAPYTFDIFDEFKKQKGYDILPILPRMLGGLAQGDMLAYRDVCTTRVADAFYGQLTRWGKKHGLFMTGHQDLEHNIRSLDSVSGHYFKNMENTDAPGIDYIWVQIEPGNFTDFPRYAGSARRLLGKEQAVSESFAATTRALYPDYMRFCMDHQIIRGISKFYLMIADPAPAENSFMGHLSKYHPMAVNFGAKLNRRTAIANRLVNTAKPSANIALYLPMEALVRDLMSNRPSSVNYSPYAPMSSYINEAAETLCYLPMDFEYIWKEAFINLEVKNGALITKEGQRIDTVIFPPAPNLERGISDKLDEFLKQGGKAIFLNNPPDDFIGRGIVVPEASALGDYIKPRVSVTPNDKISVAYRQGEDRELYFFLNEGWKAASTEIQFAGTGNIQKFDFENEMWIDIESKDGLVKEHFEPMQMSVFAVCKSKAGKIAPKAAMIQEIKNWTATTPEGTKVDLSGGLKDWCSFYKGEYSGWMSYETEIDIAEDATYRLDLGKVCYAAKVIVDGDESPGKAHLYAFAPFYNDIDLSKGRHKIRVDVINTEVSRNIGSPEAEKIASQGDPNRPGVVNRSWLRTRIGTDRRYLTSGLLGPVKLYKLD